MPDGYSSSAYTRYFLRDVLTEISGICFDPSVDGVLYAINDEEGKLIPIHLPDTKKPSASQVFGNSGDYEDLSFWKNQWWVLLSNGHIVRAHAGEEPEVFSKLLPKGEYEAMAAFGDALYVVCKQCAAGSSRSIPVYVIGMGNDGMLTLSATNMLDLSGVSLRDDKDRKLNVRPSALAHHPTRKEWYVLSANDRLLLVADEQFKVKTFHPLKASLFHQPEGIAFAPNGDLYISNEGDGGSGTLLVFPFHPNSSL